MCGLTEDEVLAIAEHEHLPEIAATALAHYLLSREHGSEEIRDMIVDDDLVPIILLYLIAFPAISNMSAAAGTDGMRGFRCGARSALHAAFYASLGDEQKAQFNNVGQQCNTRSENTPGNR